MKTEDLKKILNLIETGNKNNTYINNKGISQLGKIIFYPNNNEKSKKEQEIVKGLLKETFKEHTEDVFKSIMNYHFTSYYTPDSIINFQIDLLKKSNIKPKTILEPCAGNGAYVHNLKKAFPDAKIIALEPDYFSFCILQLNNENNKNVTCINSTFEDYILDNKKEKFDLVISNIPFGDINILNQYKHKLEFDNEKNVNTFFINNMPKLVNDKGLCFILTSKQFADSTVLIPIKENILKNNELITSIRFNNELFKEEKTKVVTDLFLLQKNNNKTKLSETEKLFCNVEEINVNNKFFKINGLYNNSPKLINGDLNTTFFNYKDDLTVIKNKVDLETFLDIRKKYIKIESINFEEVIENKNIEKLSEIEKRTNLIHSINYVENKWKEVYGEDFYGENFQKEYPGIYRELNKEEQINKIPEENKKNKIVTVFDTNFFENNTNVFKQGYNVKNGNIYHFEDGIPTKFSNPKTVQTLIDYSNLRNEYLVYFTNLINNNFNSDQIKKHFNELETTIDTFHFQHGYLTDISTLLLRDFYYLKIKDNVEICENKNPHIKKNVVLKNPNFNYNNFLHFANDKLEEKIDIEKNNVQNTSKKQEVKSIENNITKNSDNKLNQNFSVNSSVNSLESIIRNTNKKDKFIFNSELSFQDNIYNYFNVYGEININEFAQIYNLKESEILQKGFDEKLFFLNPNYDANGTFCFFKVELFELVESGNIINKIRDFNNYVNEYDFNTEEIIKYLHSIKNEKLDLNEIEFNFESFFIPIHIKESFFKYLINEDIKLIENLSSSEITLVYKQALNIEAEQRFSVRNNQQSEKDPDLIIKAKMPYRNIIQHFVENKIPILKYTKTDEFGKTEYIIDINGTKEAQNKCDELHNEFKSFIINNSEYKEIIENQYYDYFLAEKPLILKNEIINYPNTLEHKPYKHQLHGVLFSVLNQSALLDHKVGHGKSLTMGLLGNKLTQMNKANKVILSTLKTVSSQIYEEIQMNFPDLKLFLLTEKNMTPGNLRKTLSVIKNNDFDIIVCTHEHLMKFPKSLEVIENHKNKLVNMIKDDLAISLQYSGNKETKQLIKGLNTRIKNLEEAFDKNIAEYNDPEYQFQGLTIQDLGIDALMIDECHEFKNITYTTRHNNVSGLNQSAGSKMVLNLEQFISSIHHTAGKDKNVFFFSGTPIKNSVTEFYAYQRYLKPNYLEQKRLLNFDSWASVFLKQSIQTESDIYGNPRLHKRFRYFTNIPELTKMYLSFTHISDESSFATHNIKIKENYRVLEPPPVFELIKDLTMDFAQNKNQMDLFGYEKYDEKAIKASYVTALTINRNVLIHPKIEKNLLVEFNQDDDLKVQTCCKDIADLYYKTKKDKGVILVFSDIGTYKSDKSIFNVYDEIENILITKYKINPDEIDFAQKNKNTKSEFQDRLNKGDIRIAIGSTKTLGTGINAQKKIVGIVELDIPYAPDATIQRRGRGARAGNEILEKYDNELECFNYAYKNTTDIFSTALNKHKQGFIYQLKDGTSKVRIFDDIITKINDVSYGQREAMLIGDMDTFKLVKLEDDLKYIKSQYNLFTINKNNAYKRLDAIDVEQKEIITEVNALKKAHNILKDFIPNIKNEDTPQIIEKKSILPLNQLLFSFLENDKDIHFDNLEAINTFIANDIKNKNMLDLGLHKFQNINPKLYENIPNLSSITLCFQTTNFKNNLIHQFGLIVNEKYLILGNKQVKFDQKLLAYNVFKLIKNLDENIKYKESKIDHLSKSKAINIKISDSVFSDSKVDEMKNLEKEINKIKKIKLG